GRDALDAPVGEDVEQRVELLGEDGHLGLLEDDADDLAALLGLEEECPTAGLADGAGDEPVGTVEGVHATGHDLTLRHPGGGPDPRSPPVWPRGVRTFFFVGMRSPGSLPVSLTRTTVA